MPSVLTDGKTPFDVKPPWPGAKQTGRRLAFAAWLTQPDHPLTARVMVNRIWKHHFGTGIVASARQLRQGRPPPTHPELLDWLAREFVRAGWSIKAMHRLMMTSSHVPAIVRPCTPERERSSTQTNALFRACRSCDWTPNRCTTAAAGRRQARRDARRPGRSGAGSRRRTVTPRPTRDGWRRLIYVQQRASRCPTHLENFDFPQMNPNCVERRDSTVAPQALHLLNNGMVQRLARSFGERIWKEAGDNPRRPN